MMRGLTPPLTVARSLGDSPMTFRSLILASLAAGLLATAHPAAAEEAAPAAAPAAAAEKGEKEWKERVNIVARKPHRHDITWLDGRDRTSWREFTQWQGVRDERPMVARKVFGFHDPRPHVRRAERVERVSRGPIRGPAPSE